MDIQIGGCFWYYAVLTVIVIIFGWAVVLPHYAERDPKLSPDKSDLAWPANLNMWDYATHSLIPHILWTASLLLFMWGAFHADCQDSPSTNIVYYRVLFGIIAVFSFFALFLFFVARNLIWALIFNIIVLACLITLIIMYSTVHISDAWLSIPYLFMICYFIWTLWYAIRMNPNNPTIRNTRFWI
jgi:tryptophan-rich sensory protein